MQVKKECLSQPYLVTIVEDDLEYIKKQKEKYWQIFKDENSKLIERTIPGFRIENTPRSLGEKKFELAQIYKKILDEVLSKGLIESKLTIIAINSNKVTLNVNDGPITIVAEVEIAPTVKLGKYKGLNIIYDPINITGPEIDATLQRLRESHATKSVIIDRGIEVDDIVSVEFIGTIDGHEFEGGSTKKTDGKHNPWSLKIGSGQFIKGFEEQLIGAKVDESRVVKVTFPEKYHKVEFCSKEAIFNVTVKNITVDCLPQLNDEFVKKVGYQNLIEARDRLKEDLSANKQHQNEALIENKVLGQLDEVCKVSAIPKKLMNEYLDLEFQRVLRQVNLDEKSYFEKTRSTREMFDLQYGGIIEKDFRIRYIMEAIGEKENITASDIEVQTELNKEATRKKLSIDKLDKKITRKNCIVYKTLEFLKKEAKIEPSKVEETTEANVTEVTLEEK